MPPPRQDVELSVIQLLMSVAADEWIFTPAPSEAEFPDMKFLCRVMGGVPRSQIPPPAATP